MRFIHKNYRFISQLRRPLSESDPEVYQHILGQKNRQITGINLIASQNYCSNACFSAVGSILNNKYAEGYPGNRYYGGTQFVDKIQQLCKERALKAFNLDATKWGVNPQSLSGSPANLAIYTGLLEPHDRIMSLDLPHGGHLSHGFQNLGKKISAVSKYFEIFPYHVNLETGCIDYDTLHKNALIYRPKLIIAGASAYSRLIDYKKFRDICDDIGAILHADIAHPAGLMAAGLIPAPFEHCDVVMTTTHKTLRGPRGSLIFYRIGSKKDAKGNEIKYDYKAKIDAAVFPGLQGGPHMHTIAGVAVSLGQIIDPSFVQYQKQVLKNIKAVSSRLQQLGYKIVSDGTDNHLLLVDLRSKGVDGSRVQSITNQVGIFLNKNTVPGDKSALIPSAVRLGSPAMTTRGFKQQQFVKTVQLFDRCVNIAADIKKKCKGSKLKDFKDQLALQKKQSTILNQLKKEIGEFAEKYPIPGGLI